MREQLRVAAIAVDSKPGCTEENLEKIAAWSRRAANGGAELLLFPELSMTGFFPNHPIGDHSHWLREVLKGAWQTAEPLAGRAVRRLAEISAQSGVFVAAGILENAGNVLFNTHVLAGEGRIYGYWRKMHIPMFEMQIYSGGGVPDVIDTPFGRIGANICFDAFLPESTRLLAVQQPEIVLFPFAADPAPPNPAGWIDWAGPVIQARCSENAVFGVSCNYFGQVSYAGATQEFYGGAMITAPDGKRLAEWSEPALEPHMLIADLERRTLLDARSAFEYTFRFRRPELYQSLARANGEPALHLQPANHADVVAVPHDALPDAHSMGKRI
jgi:N-carbamoylputrescine amidase